MPTEPRLSADEAALLLALLPPPPRRRPLGNTPERVALAWLRRGAEAALAALLALLLLFHIAFLAPEEEPSADAEPSTSASTVLSPAQAWEVAWANLVSPPVAVQGFGYVDLPVPVLVAVLRGLHSTFANPADVSTIEDAAHAAGIDPLCCCSPASAPSSRGTCRLRTRRCGGPTPASPSTSPSTGPGTPRPTRWPSRRPSRPAPSPPACRCRRRATSRR